MVIKPFVTGITDTGELLVTKGIGSLLVLMGRTPDELTTEKISVWVERSGKNVDLAKDYYLELSKKMQSYQMQLTNQWRYVI